MPTEIPIVRTPAAVHTAVATWRREGRRVGLVPTMGALHAGHVSLLEALRAAGCDRLVASIFVNPTQFAAHEDLDRYPRDEARDVAALAAGGCDLAFAPDAAAMYPQGFATSVSVGAIATPLEGQSRPHFFGGVATVVTKLLLQVGPDVAAFGEKDYQQLLVIRRLVADLDVPVEIVAGETVRESDGLAMSSRNRYLTAEDRATAGLLPKELRACAAALADGAEAEPILAAAISRLEAAGFGPIDYFTLRCAETLAPLARVSRHAPARLFAAAHLRGVRLIDNWPAPSR